MLYKIDQNSIQEWTEARKQGKREGTISVYRTTVRVLCRRFRRRRRMKLSSRYIYLRVYCLRKLTEVSTVSNTVLSEVFIRRYSCHCPLRFLDIFGQHQTSQHRTILNCRTAFKNE